ncbi:murein transglycosylase A [Polaromonas jejuensis]|uniref:peptidoglycan lytic exotransglycosylase n=1 Tax=Polaromonas jejuensis TaxID=457502 RepID=A0ABW0Q4W4_9BURK|nr:MltA domain-containing protein [Polaromonas jejuensis]
MNTSSSNAPRASRKSRAMTFPWIADTASMRSGRSIRLASIIAIVALLAACVGTPLPPMAPLPPGADAEPTATGQRPGDAGPLPAPLLKAKSRWVPVRWAELPGFEEDALFEAWNAWIKSCERPGPTFAPLCGEVRRLSIASGEEQRTWMLARLQPYRVEALQGSAEGLLTSYYEPVFKASRQAGGAYEVPLYRTPATLGSRKPWFSRQEIDTLPEAKAALKGREIAWVADPIDALVLHIQGSGRLSISEPDGAQRTVRVAFAGSNDQPYRSVNQWLLEQGVSKVSPWPDATKAWVAQNPQRVQQLLWSNPRYIFFREEVLSDFDAAFGPKGAQGVALTPGRSIAVDPGSIPYGTPVWLASRGNAAALQKLVFAQDTGSAIVGAVRADYFAGTGAEAGEMASRVNQPLRLWVLWPK